MTGARFDVTSFGESMLRLSVGQGSRLARMSSLDVRLAGAESNVLAALAGLERRCGWFSALPTGELGEYVMHELRGWGIEPNPVRIDDSRIGASFVELATLPRSTKVIYDRSHSAITRLHPDQVDYDAIVDTRVLHLTGITAALSPSCLTIVRRLIEHAKSARVPVSFDVNFRTTLWSSGEAAASLLPLVQEVDLLLCSARDAAAVFDCQGPAEHMIEQLAQRTGSDQIVMTQGDSGLFAWDGEVLAHEPAVPVEIVDRVGAGDALAAGVLHSWLDGDFFEGLRRGALFAAIALSSYGDMTVVSAEETASLLARLDEPSSGRIDR